MIEEKIIDYFQRYPNLRILFFFDKEQEYLEEVKAMQLSDIHIEYYENNPFTTKCKLVEELKDKKVLLYLQAAQPLTQDEFHKFPLLGILLANKELQLDDVGSFMESYKLQRDQKSLVQKYMSELKYSGIQEVCKSILSPENFNEPALQRTLVSGFLKFKQPEPWTIVIAKLISLTADNEDTVLNRVAKKIKDLDFEDVVLKKIKDISGFGIQNISRENILQLARIILYNKLTQTISGTVENDPYKSLKINDSIQLTKLNQLLQDVDRHKTTRDSFDKVLRLVSKEVKGEKLIDLYGIDADFAEYTSEMIWEIINKLQSLALDAPEALIKSLETISLQADIDQTIKNTLDFFVQSAKMQGIIKGIDDYILNTPDEYIEAYTRYLHKIDTYYRRAIIAFKKLDSSEIPSKIDIDKLKKDLNTNYDDHIDNLNREWLKCLYQFKFDYRKLTAPKQYNFYKNQIENAGQKVVVVISDALRYEAAAELLSEMHSDSKNTAKMSYMLASIPSKTNVGMAQLLPGKDKIFNGGEIKIDGISSASTYRSSILEKYNSNSKAVTYGSLEGLGKQEIRDVFKNEVIYVYHDVIDSTGDSKSSERRTFNAVEEAVNELKKFVKLLHSSYNVSKVFITADHGFLYNDRKVEDKDKEKLPAVDVVLSHNRYYISTNNSERDLGYTIPISATTVFKDDLYVTIPFSVNRFKKGGVGHQFVHGGGSLQEVIIPLIESSRQREAVVNKVNPVLFNKGNFKVVSNILKLNILQENEISRLEKERIIKIGLYNENILVSNEVECLLNFTSESPSERIIRVELTLASEAGNEQFLKLKIFDKEDMLNTLIEERVQNNTLIQTDF